MEHALIINKEEQFISNKENSNQIFERYYSFKDKTDEEISKIIGIRCPFCLELCKPVKKEDTIEFVHLNNDRDLKDNNNFIQSIDLLKNYQRDKRIIDEEITELENKYEFCTSMDELNELDEKIRLLSQKQAKLHNQIKTHSTKKNISFFKFSYNKDLSLENFNCIAETNVLEDCDRKQFYIQNGFEKYDEFNIKRKKTRFLNLSYIPFGKFIGLDSNKYINEIILKQRTENSFKSFYQALNLLYNNSEDLLLYCELKENGFDSFIQYTMILFCEKIGLDDLSLINENFRYYVIKSYFHILKEYCKYFKSNYGNWNFNKQRIPNYLLEIYATENKVFILNKNAINLYNEKGKKIISEIFYEKNENLSFYIKDNYKETLKNKKFTRERNKSLGKLKDLNTDLYKTLKIRLYCPFCFGLCYPDPTNPKNYLHFALTKYESNCFMNKHELPSYFVHEYFNKLDNLKFYRNDLKILDLFYIPFGLLIGYENPFDEILPYLNYDYSNEIHNFFVYAEKLYYDSEFVEKLKNAQVNTFLKFSLLLFTKKYGLKGSNDKKTKIELFFSNVRSFYTYIIKHWGNWIFGGDHFTLIANNYREFLI